MNFGIVVGDTVEWEAPVFKGGSFFRGRARGVRCVGHERHRGVVERESYGSTGQHTFSVRLENGALKLVKGRNLYGNLLDHQHGPDHDALAEAKAPRSTKAKRAREEVQP